MKDLGKKISLIFIPFVWILITTIAIYTFLHWLLFVKAFAFNVDEEVLNLWAPLVLVWLPLLIWLRPRIKLLNLKNKSKKGNPLGGYLFVAWIVITIPLCITQFYLVTATGKLTKLNAINEIYNHQPTKYYTVNSYYIDKQRAKGKAVFEVSGKYNENFDMAIYLPCPVFAKADTVKKYPQKIMRYAPVPYPHSKALIVINGIYASFSQLKTINPANVQSVRVIKGKDATVLYGDSAKNGAIVVTTKEKTTLGIPDNTSIVTDPYLHETPVVWLATKYSKTISNHLSEDEKEAAYNQFRDNSESDFKQKDLNDFIYLDRLNYSSDLRNYSMAITGHKYDSGDGAIMIFSPVFESFEKRNGNKLYWIMGSLIAGASIFLIMLLFKPLRTDLSAINMAEESGKDRNTALIWIKSFFSVKSNLKTTRLLIGINLLVFIIMVFDGLGFISFSGEDLLKWGANYRPDIINGEYWRLFTCMFLHGGVMHVVFNMYGLFFVGIFLEPVLRPGKFLSLYLITGIISSLASAWWHPATVSVGASGAIFGMYGVFFALLTANIFPTGMKKAFLINTVVFIGYNLLFGLTGGIDNAAHIGGLLSGIVAGYIICYIYKDNLIQPVKRTKKNKSHPEIVDELNRKDTHDAVI